LYRISAIRRFGIVTVDICPACGYPTIGPELCSFCRPLVAETPAADLGFAPHGFLAQALPQVAS
jgi:hypothetical protein